MKTGDIYKVVDLKEEQPNDPQGYAKLVPAITEKGKVELRFWHPDIKEFNRDIKGEKPTKWLKKLNS